MSNSGMNIRVKANNSSADIDRAQLRLNIVHTFQVILRVWTGTRCATRTHVRINVCGINIISIIYFFKNLSSH